MKFLKEKRAEATSESVSQLTGALLAVMVIVVITGVFAILFMGSDIEPAAQEGFNALVHSIENNQLTQDTTMVNLGKYYIMQGVGCKEKCVCLYDKDGKSVKKECFSKLINISTRNKKIGPTNDKLISILKQELENKIILMDSTLIIESSLNASTGKCCVCKYVQSMPDVTVPCSGTSCMLVDISDPKCSSLPNFDVYGGMSLQCCAGSNFFN